MKTMFLDTSTNLLYVSFVIDNKVVYEVKSEGLNNHSDYLLKYIEEGLNKLSLQVKDFDNFVVGIGPGVYTGLRVSLAVAKMFAWTLNLPLYTISSLDLLTSGVCQDGEYAICFKAKKDYSYFKTIKIENGKKIRSKEEFLSNDEIDEKIDLTKYIRITHENMQINVLNVTQDQLTKVENIHALEPNYLRAC